MTRFTRNLLMVIFLMLTRFNPSTLANPAEAIRLQFRHIDSTLSMLMLGIETAGNDVKRIEALFSGILFNDSLFYSFIVADTKGDIITETSRDKRQKIFGTNVSQLVWYSEPFSKKSTIFTGVTRIGSKKYLLKSRLLYNSPGKESDSTALFVTLIDLELVFMRLQLFFDTPVALLFEENVVYESNWVNDASVTYSVPGYDKLAFAGAGNPAHDIQPSSHFSGHVGPFGWDWYLWGSIFFCFSGCVALSMSGFFLRKAKNSAFMEIAHTTLPPDEKERIHKMAVSHVYCDIKRRIETHESQDMEQRIRSEVEDEIRKKVGVN